MRAVLAILLTVTLASAQFFPFPGPGRAPSGAGSPPTYLIDEDCEGTGTPSGWTNTNSPDWDNTAVVLEGTQSLAMAGAATPPRAHYDTSANGEVWVAFRWRSSSAIGVVANQRIFSYRVASGDSEIAYVNLTTGGSLQIYHGTANAATVSTISADTLYYVWLHYKKGTGSNGEASVRFSTTTTKPTSGDAVASVTTGTSTGDVTRYQWRNQETAGTTVFYFDKMLAATSEIGNL